VISDFLRDIDDICALLGYYAALNDNPLQTFRDNVLVSYSRDFFTLEDKADRLSRNVGKEPPLDAA
jgi:hypothetical protein